MTAIWPFLWEVDGRFVVSTLIDVRESLVTLTLGVPAEKATPMPLTSGYTGDLDPVLSLQGDRLVFSSTRAGNRHLWTAQPNGADARPLTSGTSIDERPAISPDGQRIAFVSDRSGRRAIWLMNADGGALRLLTEADVLDTIRWSRDGSRLVFAVPGEQPHLQIVTVADGAVQPLKTPGPASAPGWSLREDVIAYQENQPTSEKGAISNHVFLRHEPALRTRGCLSNRTHAEAGSSVALDVPPMAAGDESDQRFFLRDH